MLRLISLSLTPLSLHPKSKSEMSRNCVKRKRNKNILCVSSCHFIILFLIFYNKKAFVRSEKSVVVNRKRGKWATECQNQQRLHYSQIIWKSSCKEITVMGHRLNSRQDFHLNWKDVYVSDIRTAIQITCVEHCDWFKSNLFDRLNDTFSSQQ